MAEEADGQDGGAEASGAGVDPAAVALALGGASREDAGAFLKDQRAVLLKQGALIDDQRHHLHEQLKRLKMGVFSDRLTIGLKLLTGFVGLAIAAGVALMVWNAAHSDGLIVESFAVPPDLAARGVTGEVAASKLLDKLVVMQNATGSNRPAQSYASNWGDDLKVEIPETGVSIGEAYRFLRGWLGHETHIGGEITRSDSGIAVTVRSGGDGGATFTGLESDLDKLMQQAAEQVYRSTQPWRYAAYLGESKMLPLDPIKRQEQNDKAISILKSLAATGSAEERAWGYYGWERQLGDSVDLDTHISLDKQALALSPENTEVLTVLGGSYRNKGMLEEALHTTQKLQSVLAKGNNSSITPAQFQADKANAQRNVDWYLGAFRDATVPVVRQIQDGNTGYFANLRSYLSQFYIGEHDLAGARNAIAAVTPEVELGSIDATSVFKAQDLMLLAVEKEDWGGVLAEESPILPALKRNPGLASSFITKHLPLLAYAQANRGDFAGAEARIVPTPADCYPCLIVRAQIADMAGDRARADGWFQRAVAAGPSLPTANAAWGQALLERGDADGAIAKFTLANQKGPHFADPLEGWGEALMKKNQSHLALAKFEEAEKYAPNWGRLHLKWGEALVYAGHKDEAQKHFALAAGLDLSAADKAELANVSHG